MSMIQVKINDEETHEYASGITAGDILENVYGKRSGAVAANIDGIEILEDNNLLIPPIGSAASEYLGLEMSKI